MEDESRELAKAHAAVDESRELAKAHAAVTVRGAGRGGRNTEFALAFALSIQEHPQAPRVYALSAGTDGSDGNVIAVGAQVDSHTLSSDADLGLSAVQHLDVNDSAGGSWRQRATCCTPDRL
jgi:hydroxypyruvate reductase